MNTMNQKRYINLLSNLYNNLSNVYLALKKTDKATEALHKAFEIRISYADTGIIETHDMLQQMLNLVNMLILAGDLELARLVLNQYDAPALRFDSFLKSVTYVLSDFGGITSSSDFTFS